MNRSDDKDRIIDAEGFRPNVGIVIVNAERQVFWGRRVNGKNSWQFPQGGISPGETPEQAMYRELGEEVGLARDSVSILACTKGWHRYRLPRRYIRSNEQPVCIGQKQRWFLLRLIAGDGAIKLDAHDSPEFDDWRWVSYWYPLTGVVDFKRDVYRSALAELVVGLSPRRKRGR